jgi:UDPglucose--hexose-1-phosphate uridylyltransferase
MSEYRYNKLERSWVLFAPNRAKRPSMLNSISEVKTDIGSCPFEKGNEHLTPNELCRIGTSDDWRCRIVPNLYNAVSIEEENRSYKQGCFPKKSGFGAHEVIIETPDHEKQMYRFSIEEFSDYLNIIKNRISDLKNDHRLKYFSIFKNHGENAGATMEHSHSQLIATPFLPKREKEDLEFYKDYKKETDRDFFTDIIYEELNIGETILFEDSMVIAFCPYASKYAFEVHIIVKDENINSILDCEDKHIYALSETMEFVYSKLFNALGDFSFNMILKNGDITSKNNSNRFHIKILPRLYKIAGFELDSDIFINTFLPESAAKILLGDE